MFEVTIDEFNGPLDLMLYLIKDNKLDLFNLNISVLTDQYIDYIHQMEELKLEIASEYLAELAGLIEYKSKKLLPRDKSELDADKPEEGPTLVQRLLEYQKFKEITQTLNDRYLERLDHYTKSFSKEALQVAYDEAEAQSSIDGNVYDLIKAMEKVMGRFQAQHPFETTIINQELSVDERIDQLRDFLFIQTSTFKLTTLFEQSHSMQHLIVTFLAVLDMIRMHELLVTFDDDDVYLKGSEARGAA